MNSEKVKEIKEALKQNDGSGIVYAVDYKKRTCKFIHHEDILTLINELESENKRLNKAINNVQKGFDNGEFISKDCKIRALKQFAEKLKETAFRMSPNSNEKFIYAQNVDVILDKLLKEYEK